MLCQGTLTKHQRRVTYASDVSRSNSDVLHNKTQKYSIA